MKMSYLGQRQECEIDPPISLLAFELERKSNEARDGPVVNRIGKAKTFRDLNRGIDPESQLALIPEARARL